MSVHPLSVASFAILTAKLACLMHNRENRVDHICAANASRSVRLTAPPITEDITVFGAEKEFVA
jgi:hypothetical protein